MKREFDWKIEVMESSMIPLADFVDLTVVGLIVVGIEIAVVAVG